MTDKERIAELERQMALMGSLLSEVYYSVTRLEIETNLTPPIAELYARDARFKVLETEPK